MMTKLATAPNNVETRQSRLTLEDSSNSRTATVETFKSPVLSDTLNGGIAPGVEGNYNEIFYVIDGEVEVKSDVFEYTAKKGSFVIIAPGQDLKSLKNNTNKKVSLLWL